MRCSEGLGLLGYERLGEDTGRCRDVGMVVIGAHDEDGRFSHRARRSSFYYYRGLFLKWKTLNAETTRRVKAQSGIETRLCQPENHYCISCRQNRPRCAYLDRCSPCWRREGSTFACSLIPFDQIQITIFETIFTGPGLQIR